MLEKPQQLKIEVASEKLEIDTKWNETFDKFYLDYKSEINSPARHLPSYESFIVTRDEVRVVNESILNRDIQELSYEDKRTFLEKIGKLQHALKDSKVPLAFHEDVINDCLGDALVEGLTKEEATKLIVYLKRQYNPSRFNGSDELIKAKTVAVNNNAIGDRHFVVDKFGNGEAPHQIVDRYNRFFEERLDGVGEHIKNQISEGVSIPAKLKRIETQDEADELYEKLLELEKREINMENPDFLFYEILDLLDEVDIIDESQKDRFRKLFQKNLKLVLDILEKTGNPKFFQQKQTCATQLIRVGKKLGVSYHNMEEIVMALEMFGGHRTEEKYNGVDLYFAKYMEDNLEALYKR